MNITALVKTKQPQSGPNSPKKKKQLNTCQLSLHLNFLVRPGRRFLRCCGAFHPTLRQDGQTERERERKKKLRMDPASRDSLHLPHRKNKHEAYSLIACLSIVRLCSVYGQHASRLWLLHRRMPRKGFSPSAGEKSKRKSLPRKKEAKRRIRKRMRQKMSKRVQMRKQSSN